MEVVRFGCRGPSHRGVSARRHSVPRWRSFFFFQKHSPTSHCGCQSDAQIGQIEPQSAWNVPKTDAMQVDSWTKLWCVLALFISCTQHLNLSLALTWPVLFVSDGLTEREPWLKDCEWERAPASIKTLNQRNKNLFPDCFTVVTFSRNRHTPSNPPQPPMEEGVGQRPFHNVVRLSTIWTMSAAKTRTLSWKCCMQD